MASLRYRNDKWQVQVRRDGHTPGQVISIQSLMHNVGHGYRSRTRPDANP